jgi:hypothetical protein
MDRFGTGKSGGLHNGLKEVQILLMTLDYPQNFSIPSL